MTGELAFIAGGTSGIGLASATALAAAGCRVVLGGRNPEAGEDACASLRAGVPGAEVTFVELDVRDPDCGAVLEASGPVTILVNCVGSAPAGTFDAVDDAVWGDALDGKVVGAVRLMRAALAPMRAAGHGRIINITGTAGREPDSWMPVAGAANAALAAISKAAAAQLAPEAITVNCIAPGPIQTRRWDGLVSTYAGLTGTPADEAARALQERVPRGVVGRPEEVAAAVAFFASPAAAHITGTQLAIDGGQSRGL